MKNIIVSRDSAIAVSQDLEQSSSDTRFAFGKNWQRFLRSLDDERISEAEKSLRMMLDVENLNGKSFLDIGCGSGLFSLAAMRLGASRVHSFDYDAQSVACALELRRRYFHQADNWTIEQGSVLDPMYLSLLGQFDVVYSWGVLHHTGNMWQALENVAPMVEGKGKLFIALYNDQDVFSRLWSAVKKLYNRGYTWRVPIVMIFGTFFAARGFLKDALVLHSNPLRRYQLYKRSRGMSYFTDLLDWLGGYPFEVTKPESILDYFRAKGFELVKLTTAGGGYGNNEFVFLRHHG
jgi:2-polyprenyl-6-hydroxyphenyl methylase/3-demethylubiquinone-9 3-methyltransferase